MPGAKRNQEKKTGTLTWTEYCECEMLRQTEENDKLKHQHQLEMQELRRHYLEVGDDYEAEIAKLKEEYQELIEDFAKKEEERHTLVERIHELEGGCCEWSIENTKLEDELAELKKELAELKAK